MTRCPQITFPRRQIKKRKEKKSHYHFQDGVSINDITTIPLFVQIAIPDNRCEISLHSFQAYLEETWTVPKLMTARE